MGTLGCGGLPFKHWLDGVPGAMSGQCGLADLRTAVEKFATVAAG